MIEIKIKTEIGKLESEKRNLEINLNRIEAAIWAFNETLKMMVAHGEVGASSESSDSESSDSESIA